MEQLGLTSNIDLIELGKKYKLKLNAVLCKDQYKGVKVKNGCYIINLDDSENGGTHWTALYIDNLRCCYWDSFGGKIPTDILRFIKKSKCKKIIYNLDTIQNINSEACGYYCVAFLNHISKHNKNMGHSMNKFNSLFNKNNTKHNKQILKEYLKNI